MRTANIASPASPLDTEIVTGSPTASPKNSGEASGEPVPHTQSAGEAGEAISSPFAEICNSLSQVTNDERQKMADLLTALPALTLKAFRVGDKVANNKSIVSIVCPRLIIVRRQRKTVASCKTFVLCVRQISRDCKTNNSFILFLDLAVMVLSRR
jgi:hypothetical protein